MLKVMLEDRVVEHELKRCVSSIMRMAEVIAAGLFTAVLPACLPESQQSSPD